MGRNFDTLLCTSNSYFEEAGRDWPVQFIQLDRVPPENILQSWGQKKNCVDPWKEIYSHGKEITVNK